MTDIQQARNILDKWREGAKPGPWSKDADIDWDGTTQAAITTGNGPLTWDDHGGDVFTPDDARLIVGTAGNPDFLRIIDRMLEGEANAVDADPYIIDLAAAIIAADERMSA